MVVRPSPTEVYPHGSLGVSSYNTVYCFFTAQHSLLVSSILDKENGVYIKGVVSAIRNFQSSQASKQYISYNTRKDTGNFKWSEVEGQMLWSQEVHR